MVDNLLPIRLDYSRAGIKRDGTQFEGDYYVDGKWVRFQRGLPRKMLGYTNIAETLSGPPRELHLFNNINTYIHSGGPNLLEQLILDPNDVPLGTINDRTPAGFTPDPNNDWQFDESFDSASTQNRLIAHAAPNLASIAQSAVFPYYTGDITAAAALVAVAGSDCSGGIVGLHPYVFRYSSDGFIGWSVPNAPTDIVGAGSGTARVTGQKIIKGLPLRGGSNSPAGLFWSLDSIIRAYFVGTPTFFQFDVITAQSSILSANSVIDYDGVYYWCGTDRFLMFNGVIQEVPNDVNLNFFFDNINYAVQGKVFAHKVPRWGEIWFCAPLFGATEPNWAVIFNVRESKRLGFPVWYDTPLPESGRGAAFYSQVHPKPFMTGLDVRAGKYILWRHEDGVDKIDGTNVLGIESNFETADTSFATMPNGQIPDKNMHCEFIEPDFIQDGDMTVQITGRSNARAPQQNDEIKTFPANASGPDDQVVPTRGNFRQMRFRFSSNVAGGDYQMGTPLAHIRPSDGRFTT